MLHTGTDIVIIKGCPGSGKSQTAKKLSQFFPKGAKIEVDTLRQMVISVDWTNQAEHIHMLQVSAGLSVEFLGLGFKPVIIVDTFSGNKIKQYLETLYQFNKDLSIYVFGLFTTDDELKRRLEMRSSDQFTDFEICKRINDDLLKFKSETEIQINTTGLSATQTAEIIHGYIV